MTTAEFERLAPGAIRKGGTLYVLCPTHDDHNPSCSVKDGDRTDLLFYCHANRGCTHRGIRAAFTEQGILPKWKKRTRDERDAAVVITPVPDDAKPCPPKLLGDLKWKYTDSAGKLLGYVRRIDKPNGKKDFQPIVYARFPDGRCEWTFKGFPGLRPLFGLKRLADSPTAPVLVVEGEGCATTAQKVLTGYVVVSPCGGAKAFALNDWTPLSGRDVTFWPDADDVGRAAATEIAKSLGARVLDTTELPQKFDIADAVAGAPAGKFGSDYPAWTAEQIASFVATGTLPEGVQRWTQPDLASLADMLDPNHEPAEKDENGWFTEAATGRKSRGLAGGMNEIHKPNLEDYIERVGGKKESDFVRMSNFRMYIATDLILDKGNGREHEERNYEMALYQHGAEKPRLAKVEPSEFVGGFTSWAHRAFGSSIVVTAGEERKLVQAIGVASNKNGVAERRTYAFTGWHRHNGKLVYLFHGGAMGAEGIRDDILVELPAALRPFQLVKPLTGDALRDAIKREVAFMRLFPQVTVPIVCAIWRAPLKVETRYALQVTGETGAFKTEIALVAQRHTGTDWTDALLPMDWVSTLASLEIPANAMRYTIGVVDNFRPSKISPKRRADYRAKGDEFIAFLANKRPKERSLWSAGLKAAEPLLPHVLPISTNEETIGDPGSSTRARSLLADISRADLSDTEAGRAAMLACTRDAANGVFVGLYSAYIQYLAEETGETRFDRIGAQLPEQERAWRDKYQSEGMHRRAPDIIASQMMGFTTFSAFVEHHFKGENLVSNDDLELVKRTLLALAEAASTNASEANLVDRYAALLASAINSGKGHLISAKTGGEPSDPTSRGWIERPQAPRKDSSGNDIATDPIYERRGDRVGWIEDDHDGSFWIDADKAWELVEAQSRADGGLGISKDDLHKRLMRAGRLASARYKSKDANGKPTNPSPLQQKKGLKGAVGKISGLLHLVPDFFDSDPSRLKRRTALKAALAAQTQIVIDGLIATLSNERLVDVDRLAALFADANGRAARGPSELASWWVALPDGDRAKFSADPADEKVRAQIKELRSQLGGLRMRQEDDDIAALVDAVEAEFEQEFEQSTFGPIDWANEQRRVAETVPVIENKAKKKTVEIKL